MTLNPNFQRDSRQDYLNEIAARLLQLLQESSDLEADKELAEDMLYQAGLWDQTMPEDLHLARFCNRLIAQNPLLFEVIEDVRAEPILSQVDNVEELIHACIPSKGDVQL